MNRFKNHLIAGAVFALLLTIGSIMNVHQVKAQGPPGGLAVNIVNPLPVPVTGSTTVSGTIAATQSGPWNVGLTGQPISVKNVDERGREPFTVTFSCEASLACSGAIGAIPAGKRFVVEHANGFAPPNTLISVGANNNITGQPEGPVSFLPSTSQTATISIVNADLLLYIEPLKGVAFSVSRGDINAATTVTLTGHLVDLTI